MKAEYKMRPGGRVIKTPWYCHGCGKQDVWQRTDASDDYYHGYSADCHGCGMGICCVGKVEAMVDGDIEVVS